MKFSEAVKQRKKGGIEKWEHFFPIYDSYFEEAQNQPLSLLEIGVKDGGSLFTWKEYFPKASITGIDIDPDCKRYEEGNIKVFIGDQADPKFLESVNEQTGPYDIIIDDGGHMMNQQIISFKTLFCLLKDGGYYVIEDWHTSFMPEYFDGGEKTIDFLKNLIDRLNFWAIEGSKPGYFSLNISYIGFHNAIVFIKKGRNREGKVIKE
ncbi:MAG: class I SAM-dependent methyltransferase [Candidatus Daviesbacteria bacterium]|nr:class I SAM-dependent methyltransferase [Candidatus Daviesbacteria bacterium]